MRAYSLSHLSDAVLLCRLALLVANDRRTIAALLAHVAEVDARRLYLPAGYASMHSYCVEELKLSEDSARKRIHAARAAHRVPGVLFALAEGRIHLSGLVVLAPYLTPENAERLLTAATHKTRAEVERLVVEHFPKLDEPVTVQAISDPTVPMSLPTGQRAPGRVQAGTPAAVEAPRPKLSPLAPERFALRLTIGKDTHDKLIRAQTLLSHCVPSGDVAQVLDRALDALIRRLEKRKTGDTSMPRRPRPTTSRRHIPAHVRRAVWERDQGQCTFVGKNGHRCGERRFLEYDHANPVARGGHATAENMRLRCRAHNQFEAERTLGTGFMNQKREQARRAAARARAQAAADQARDVMAGLRELGVRATDARRAVEYSLCQPGATIEERMRWALKFLCPRVARSGLPSGAST